MTFDFDPTRLQPPMTDRELATIAALPRIAPRHVIAQYFGGFFNETRTSPSDYIRDQIRNYNSRGPSDLSREFTASLYGWTPLYGPDGLSRTIDGKPVGATTGTYLAHRIFDRPLEPYQDPAYQGSSHGELRRVRYKEGAVVIARLYYLAEIVTPDVLELPVDEYNAIPMRPITVLLPVGGDPIVPNELDRMILGKARVLERSEIPTRPRYA